MKAACLMTLLLMLNACNRLNCDLDGNSENYLLLFPYNKLQNANRIDTMVYGKNYSVYNVHYNCEGMEDYGSFYLLKKKSVSDSHLYQVPYSWELFEDSILFTNTHLLSSRSEDGLVVTTRREGSTTHFTYPESDRLHHDSKDIKGHGLYRYENGTFKKISKAQSKKEFDRLCVNGTFYVPFPGRLFDEKIILEQIETWP